MKIICIGRNYAKHAKEMGSDVPDKPMLFMKPPSALLVNNKPLYYPEFTRDLQYEAEVVLKICNNGKHVQPEFAHRYYDQIAFGIDFTARDLQSECKKKGHPWEIAKGFDNSAAISTFTDLTDDQRRNGINFSLRKNGEEVQRGNTQEIIFSFDRLIVYISRFFKLQVGDLIYTGTPEGVGPVQIGDILEGYIENNKKLECTIK